MHEHLMLLNKIDELDRGIWRVQARVTQHKSKLKEAEEASAQAESARLAAQGEVNDADKQLLTLQRKATEFNRNRTSATHLLETGQGDPEAAQRQVDRCEILIDEVETEELELMERLDALRSALNGAMERAALRLQELKELQSTLPQEIDALRAEGRALGGSRDSLLTLLPQDLRRRYDHFRAHRKWAVAHVDAGSCGACHHRVPPQHIAELRKGLLRTCLDCKRWLVPPQ